MMASDNLPDIVEYNWANYPGGPGKAIEDGKIIRLNEYIEEYCPELKQYLDEHEEVAKVLYDGRRGHFWVSIHSWDAELMRIAGTGCPAGLA